MSINTKKVKGRRQVRYETYDDLLADTERLSRSQVRTLGNWSQGQIYKHLAMSLNSAIDGTGFKLPAPMRFIFTLLMKKKFIYGSISAGFKSMAKFIPGETSVDDGLLALKNAIARQKQESKRTMHPAFGNISREEWDQFNLRHAEMHMSFLVDGAS